MDAVAIVLTLAARILALFMLIVRKILVIHNSCNTKVIELKLIIFSVSLSLVQSNPKLSSTMRIFHLSSLHGPFIAQELLYPLRSPDHISPFPFIQSDLYELHQPALCLIDTDTEIYIWQGWNDQSDDELGLQLSNANLLVRAPRDIRFTTERRCAFRTAIDYNKSKYQI